jgi:nucleoside-diphosphate-sugar epimerase
MSILISGIHGFVGTNLVSSYKRQHSIYGLDIISPQKEGVLNTYVWDELDKIQDIDIVIHLAGKAHDTKNQTNSEAYFEINTGLTKKIYDWFLKSNAKKFIFFSSVKAAADKVEGEFLIEDITPKPAGPYGESKIAAEEYILNNLQPEKQVYILRPCMIHGPGNKGNLNLLYKIVSKGIPWPLGSFDNKRSFCSIDNLSFVIKNLIEKDIKSGIYQVADDQPLSTNQLVELIAQSLHKKSRVWNINQILIKILAKTGNILRLPLNTERLQKLTESYVVSNEKLKRALSISNMPVTAEDGMMKTLDSFRKKTN